MGCSFTNIERHSVYVYIYIYVCVCVYMSFNVRIDESIRIMQESPWITILGSRVRRFANENHWQIASRVTQKSVFTVTNVLFYFSHAILCPGTHNSAKNHNRSLISQLSPRTAVSDFALWRHHSWYVTSREREILALWRHICRLFLHVKIGAKAIFTSE